MLADERRKRVRQLALTGVDRSRTRRALALAVGFGVVTALLRGYAPHTPGVGLVFGLLHAFTLEAVPASMPTEGVGVVTVMGLAAIHAALNEGYGPSLVLAMAPSYGNYVINGPGVAPLWAAEYVLPYGLTVGTVGFLLGVSLRWGWGWDRLPVPRTLTPE